MRAIVSVPGTRAHSARSWLGVNAIHGAGAVLARLNAYQARTVEVEGPVVEQWSDRIAAENDFTDVSHTLEIFGICGSCRTGIGS